MSRWKYWGLALAVGVSSCKASGAAEPDLQPPVEVELGKVELSRIRDTADYIATLKSRRSIAIRPQAEGLITRIAVHSGSTVKKGDLLMQIDPERQFHTLSSQRAGAAAKKAALGYANQEYARVKRIFQSGAASQQELDQALNAQLSAQADLDALGAQVRESEVQLRYFSVLAPEAGVVGDIPVREGDYVTPGMSTLLTTVDENHELEVYLSVPVERASDLKLGTTVQLTDDTGRVVGDSHVTFISPRVDEDTQSVLVKALVPNGAGELRGSQFVRAKVVWSEREGAVIPVSAVKHFNGQSFAFAAVEKNGHLVAVQQPVVVGPVDGPLYPLISGLAAGDAMVISGLQKLHDGSMLKPLAPATAPKG